MANPSATQSVLVIAAVQLGDLGEYQCVIMNGCGSVRSQAALLQVCQGDINCDGFVNGDDFDGYVAAFEAGTTDADFNGDGFVTGDDFDAFVDAFEAGC